MSAAAATAPRELWSAHTTGTEPARKKILHDATKTWHSQRNREIHIKGHKVQAQSMLSLTKGVQCGG